MKLQILLEENAIEDSETAPFVYEQAFEACDRVRTNTGLWKRFYYARTSRANKDALSGGQITAIVIRSAPRVLDGFVAQFGILFMTSISWNVYDQVI